MLDHKIFIRQKDAMRVLAILSHLRVLLSACVSDDGKINSPSAIDQGQLLLCSASLRALFFDEKPILLNFLKENKIDFPIECIETDSSVIFISVIAPGESHLSDLLMEILFSPEMHAAFPENSPRPVVQFVHGAPLVSDMLKKVKIWLPEAGGPQFLGPATVSLGMGATEPGVSQYFNITRRIVSIHQWPYTIFGTIKHINITRRNIVSYVANKLGGVHYDSLRVAENDLEKSQFKILSEAYDFSNQSFVHAGLIAIAQCAIEIVRNDSIGYVFNKLNDFYASRQERLARGDIMRPPSEK